MDSSFPNNSKQQPLYNYNPANQMEATFSNIIDRQPSGKPPNYKSDHQTLMGSPTAPPQPSYAPDAGAHASRGGGGGSAFDGAVGCESARCHRTPFPTRVVCPLCQSVTITETKPVVGASSLLLSLIMCVHCLLPCACIPCYAPKCMDVEHKCRNCKQKVGLFKRMF